ncbi:hypothetical protein MCAG_03827 [Micromonospora sp. ATCC 39149]|uniref:DUF7426 family protein n=1 Tax=Micromonospora sp. (strain ATCC 39149 / NRRL 15099 / SCC 1413) TaxID=219305 RepID=UPI0001A504CE|nr:hypothetical protein MCAG_03827 [Micromonospora sp. ATCC 39149]
MSTRLDDLTEYFAPGLTLTVRGREYAVPLATAELGLWCRLVAQVTGQVHAASTEEEIRAAADRIEALPELPGGSELTLAQRVLGDVYGQMVADQVPDPYVEYCGVTAYLWIVAGEDAAARWWRSGGRPEAAGPANRADRRAAQRKTSTAEATATPSPASTSGTSSRPRSARSGGGRGSRGRRS